MLFSLTRIIIFFIIRQRNWKVERNYFHNYVYLGKECELFLLYHLLYMIYNMPLSNFVHFNYIYSNILIFYCIWVDVIFYCFYQMFLFCIVHRFYWFSKSIICSGFYFYKYPFIFLLCYNVYFTLSCIKVSIYNFISICF